MHTHVCLRQSGLYLIACRYSQCHVAIWRTFGFIYDRVAIRRFDMPAYATIYTDETPLLVVGSFFPCASARSPLGGAPWAAEASGFIVNEGHTHLLLLGEHLWKARSGHGELCDGIAFV